VPDALVASQGLGSLVGAISGIPPRDPTDEREMRAIFANGFYIGAGINAISTQQGYLYLLMNDNWTYEDNNGAVTFSVSFP
jgi:hypothetical protein